MASRPDPHRATPGGQPRARALGIPFGGRPGRWNAITDVPGVEVGYVTLIEGEAVRTGVTAIHPRGPAGTGDPVAAGFHAQNGNGEMTGVSWINESGTFNGPVAITNTHAVGVAHAGVIAWTVRHHPDVAEVWLLPVAAETWDGYPNDINGHHVTEEIVVAAIEAARSGPVEEGSVGGGTGMNCYHFKGGSGTASRLVPHAGRTTRSACSCRPTSAPAGNWCWLGSRSAPSSRTTTRCSASGWRRRGPPGLAEEGHRVVPAHRAQPLLAQAEPGQPADLPGVGIGDVREIAAEQDPPGQPELTHQRQ